MYIIIWHKQVHSGVLELIQPVLINIDVSRRERFPLASVSDALSFPFPACLIHVVTFKKRSAT